MFRRSYVFKCFSIAEIGVESVDRSARACQTEWTGSYLTYPNVFQAFGAGQECSFYNSIVIIKRILIPFLFHLINHLPCVL
jgi:hypothetical protein